MDLFWTSSRKRNWSESFSSFTRRSRYQMMLKCITVHLERIIYCSISRLSRYFSNIQLMLIFCCFMTINNLNSKITVSNVTLCWLINSSSRNTLSSITEKTTNWEYWRIWTTCTKPRSTKRTRTFAITWSTQSKKYRKMLFRI